MKPILPGLGLAVTLYAAPVLAQDAPDEFSSLPEGDWYVSAEVGPAWFDGPADTGFTAGAALGYDFAGPFRAEFDVSYHRTEFDRGGFGVLRSADINAWTFLINGFYDLYLQSPFTPYVGVGFGLASVGAEVTVIDPLLGTISTEADDTDFAYNLMVGVAYDLSEATALTAQFRYTDEPDTSVLEAGVRWGF